MEEALRLQASLLEQTRNLRKLEESGDSDILKFFAGKTVLVTGGTGFLGKQLIEKLLRLQAQVRSVSVRGDELLPVLFVCGPVAWRASARERCSHENFPLRWNSLEMNSVDLKLHTLL
ncbi:Putative fatty acyl-CoA reductase CG5065 [Eumeta japonica]|uniref:Fatty acyl-CoA reductase CG5065 n=1 Tax=Eumeta variegata TaxID=151549 RepID=A0A4C1XCC0_EUMVA|nr:Putative fatty acyl-CoA reductase CG5065 [Eumeta japonica]